MDQVARRAELSQAEVNEDLYFLRRVRTQHNYGALLRAQAEQLPLEQIRKTFESMQVRCSPSSFWLTISSSSSRPPTSDTA